MSGYEKLADEAFRTTWMMVAEHPKRTVKMLIALGDAVEDLLRDYHVQYEEIAALRTELAQLKYPAALGERPTPESQGEPK